MSIFVSVGLICDYLYQVFAIIFCGASLGRPRSYTDCVVSFETDKLYPCPAKLIRVYLFNLTSQKLRDKVFNIKNVRKRRFVVPNMAVGSLSQARLEDPTYFEKQFQNQPKLFVPGRTKWRNNFISLIYYVYFIFILKSGVNWAGFSFINFEYPSCPFALFFYSIKAQSIREGLGRDRGLLRSNPILLFAGLILDLLNLIKRRLASKITCWHMQILVWFSYCFLDVTGALSTTCTSYHRTRTKQPV